MQQCPSASGCVPATANPEPAADRPGSRQGILRPAQWRCLKFVDASAIVAVPTGEAEGDSLADVLESGRTPVSSAIAIFDATLGICRKRHMSVDETEQDVREFLEMADIRVVPITHRETETALTGFPRYGKGRGHPAQTNLGDCFACVAENHRASLLLQREDFDKTDIPVAGRL